MEYLIFQWMLTLAEMLQTRWIFFHQTDWSINMTLEETAMHNKRLRFLKDQTSKAVLSWHKSKSYVHFHLWITQLRITISGGMEIEKLRTREGKTMRYRKNKALIENKHMCCLCRQRCTKWIENMYCVKMYCEILRIEEWTQTLLKVVEHITYN